MYGLPPHKDSHNVTTYASLSLSLSLLPLHSLCPTCLPFLHCFDFVYIATGCVPMLVVLCKNIKPSHRLMILPTGVMRYGGWVCIELQELHIHVPCPSLLSLTYLNLSIYVYL